MRNAQDQYCCLGVLADVVVKAKKLPYRWEAVFVDDAGIPAGWRLAGDDGDFSQYYSAYLPRDITALAGLEDDTVPQGSLTALNDTYGWTFAQIAQLLRLTVLGCTRCGEPFDYAHENPMLVRDDILPPILVHANCVYDMEYQRRCAEHPPQLPVIPISGDEWEGW